VRDTLIPRKKSLRALARRSTPFYSGFACSHLAPISRRAGFASSHPSSISRILPVCRICHLCILRKMLNRGRLTIKSSDSNCSRSIYFSTHSAGASQVVLATALVSVPCEIFIPNVSKMYPFIMIWVKYHIFLLRFIRRIQFRSLPQITIRHLLSNSRVGIPKKFFRKYRRTGSMHESVVMYNK